MNLFRSGGLLLLSLFVLLASCAPAPQASGKKTIVVTYSILGSLVTDLVGDQFEVVVSMPNGLDPHEWEPSAKDIESLNKAALIVQNGEGLEAGLDEALDQAAAAGVPVFTASEHMTLLENKEHEGEEEHHEEGEKHEGEDEHHHGAHDPHLWLDAQGMKSVVTALAEELKTRFGTDLGARATDLTSRLEALDAEVKSWAATVPADRRKMVTGHESLGYFAHAYDFTLVGAVIPSLSSRAEVSASDMANLKKTIAEQGVKVIFTELGTPPKVVEALATEAGVKAVAITTHGLLEDGSYFTFLRTLAKTITESLAG